MTTIDLARDFPTALSDVCHAYRDFFDLFEGFPEFVGFFHFNDLVSDDFEQIWFVLPFDDFTRQGAPRSVEEYVAYREATVDFISARGRRIGDWVATAQP